MLIEIDNEFNAGLDKLATFFERIYINNGEIITNINKYVDENDFKENIEYHYSYLNMIFDALHSTPWHHTNIVEKIKNLSYKQFLQTRYWKIISEYCKFKYEYKCSVCFSPKILNTHHKTYIHHGNEAIYLNDLVVLCGECHSKYHEVIK